MVGNKQARRTEGNFEIPWFGVGEDVESASMLESVLRAAIFVVAVWLIIAAVAAPFAMVHFSDIWIHATKKETPDYPPPNTALPLTAGVSAETSILAELKGVNSNLVAMQGLLAKQEQWLAALNQAKPDLAGIEGLLTQQERASAPSRPRWSAGAAGRGHQGYAGQAGAALWCSGPDRARHGRYQGCAGQADPAARRS